MNRREFIIQAGAAGLLAGCSTRGIAGAASRTAVPQRMWAVLLQHGVKMWEKRAKSDTLQFNEDLWKETIDRMVARKVNVLVWDLGEAMVYPSHPELRVKGSWEPERVRDEIARLKKMGILAIPKLNFSPAHDQWMGKWRPYLSTPEHNRVCGELIADVARVFDEAPLFHLGMDEEEYRIQNINKFQYIRIRRGELWLRDFEFLCQEVRSHGMRPWIWWSTLHRQAEPFAEFTAKIPKDVLMNPGIYDKGEYDLATATGDKKAKLESFHQLAKLGFEQVPMGSPYAGDDNMKKVYDFTKDIKGVRGHMMAPWVCTLKGHREKILRSVDQIGDVIDAAGV